MLPSRETPSPVSHGVPQLRQPRTPTPGQGGSRTVLQGSRAKGPKRPISLPLGAPEADIPRPGWCQKLLRLFTRSFTRWSLSQGGSGSREGLTRLSLCSSDRKHSSTVLRNFKSKQGGFRAVGLQSNIQSRGLCVSLVFEHLPLKRHGGILTRLLDAVHAGRGRGTGVCSELSSPGLTEAPAALAPDSGRWRGCLQAPGQPRTPGRGKRPCRHPRARRFSTLPFRAHWQPGCFPTCSNPTPRHREGRLCS